MRSASSATPTPYPRSSPATPSACGSSRSNCAKHRCVRTGSRGGRRRRHRRLAQLGEAPERSTPSNWPPERPAWMAPPPGRRGAAVVEVPRDAGGGGERMQRPSAGMRRRRASAASSIRRGRRSQSAARRCMASEPAAQRRPRARGGAAAQIRRSASRSGGRWRRARRCAGASQGEHGCEARRARPEHNPVEQRREAADDGDVGIGLRLSSRRIARRAPPNPAMLERCRRSA